ncbi:Endopolygalacturonase [Bifidobacterium sp. DSM 109958]|uniref:Endopolygalacturonase n=1 Tax=Bifidobacterium moraviense TaxID=2675323 RepID=A0A7Y0F2T7_9BIFI|nr:hypothetical protein [Bifidobacterium sp. DSM 109958]NMN00958.1 Endopolygalacturonase [Bifidobacterium sp. DSM 109958]
MAGIPRATGCRVTKEALANAARVEDMVSIEAFGAEPGGDPQTNTLAVNRAIARTAADGGGTVRVPAGRFAVYTVMLASGVNLYLDEGAVLAAARHEGHDHAALYDVTGPVAGAMGGGNYAEPEVNRYVGLQDHAHTYLRNSFVLGVGLRDVMVYGPGRFDGSWTDPVTGMRQEVLTYADPEEPERRDRPGHRNGWWGDKGIALVDCEHVVLQGFEMLLCGHFAIIATGCRDLLVDGVTVDSQRDGIDVDGCEDVTVRGSLFNTLHDDALVIKASYGAQRFAHTRNVLVEDCTVSGYDAGSVLAGAPATDRQVAEGGCGPMGRVKLGTESTCGYSLVTVRNVRFERCMGLAIEAVDGSDVYDVVAEHLTMDGVTTAPIYIRCGDRGRYPVTGVHGLDGGQWVRPQHDVRLDAAQWVLPDGEGYERHPARRYAPAYRRRAVSVDGFASFPVVDGPDPVHVNPANVHVDADGAAHPMVYDDAEGRYVPDMAVTLDARGVAARGNAFGCERIARCRNIEISDVRARDVDPRYPIIIAGLVDARAQNVTLRDIDVEYRGGLTMRDAVEQRMVRTPWTYRESDMVPDEQLVSWLVNPGHAHNETLLPRVSWDPDAADGAGAWRDDPCNVPEGVSNYPDPDEFGILPAWGLYARHVEGLDVQGLSVRALTPEGRYAMVLDDVSGGVLRDVAAAGGRLDGEGSVPDVAVVRHHRKRPTGYEYLPDEPYRVTDVTDVTLPRGAVVECVDVTAPEPGTPADSLYALPTVATRENGFAYSALRSPSEGGDLPATVYMPYLTAVPAALRRLTVGVRAALHLSGRDPIDPRGLEPPTVEMPNPPEGASFDGSEFVWTPAPEQEGAHDVEVLLRAHGRTARGVLRLTVA